MDFDIAAHETQSQVVLPLACFEMKCVQRVHGLKLKIIVSLKEVSQEL